MHRPAKVVGALQVREDLVTHCTGLEGSAWLDILQLQKDPTSCCAGEGGGFHQGGFDPWGFEDRSCFCGRDASHDG